MNNITIAGQLGKDAEVRFLPNGDPVSNFSIADSQGKNKDTIWWNCQIFGKRAESLSPYLVKGQSLTVSGIVVQRKYTDKNGQEKIATNVNVNELALQGGRKESGQAPAEKKPAQSNPGSFADMDDDIPF
jgi:single-strand DNA-binding protein